MRVKREDLLKKLDAIQWGLATREMVQQSNCFLFQKGSISTYNDEMFCSAKSDIPISGAVQSKPLLELLRRMEEDEIQIEATDSEFIIRGSSNRRRKASIRLEKEILISFEALEPPEEWFDLPEGFNQAVNFVQSCAGKDANYYGLTCLHLHPEKIEASNRLQCCSYSLDTGFTEPILVSRDSIKQIPNLGMKKYSISRSWIHFRRPGLKILCRLERLNYPDSEPILKTKGKEFFLPRELKEAAEKAEIFSAENPDDNMIKIMLSSNTLKIRAEGASGWYSERLQVKYNGPDIAFAIAPTVLKEIFEKGEYKKCNISKDKIRLEGSNWRYVSVLGELGNE